MIWVENGIVADLERALERVGLAPEYGVFPSASTSLQTELTDRLKDGGYAVALLRSSRAADTAQALGTELSERVRKGSLRVAYWGDPVPSGSGEDLGPPLPALFIPSGVSTPLLECLINHLTRADSPGVRSVLPEGATIITEKLSTEAEIGRKLDKILQLAVGTAKGTIPSSWTLRARLAISACLVPAFEEGRLLGKLVLPQLQLGVADSVAAFAIRWRTGSSELESWARLSLPPGPVKAECRTPAWIGAARLADALWLHLLPDAGEMEILILMDREAAERGEGPPPLANSVLGLDLITNGRLVAIRNSGCENRPPENFSFQALELTPVPESPPSEAPVPIPPVPHEELLLKNEKLESTVKEYKEQLRTVNRRMRDLLQLEEDARAESRQLSLQLKLEKTRNQSTVLYDELESTREKLSESRAREQELNRKLLLCLDKLEKLQSQVQNRQGFKGKREA